MEDRRVLWWVLGAAGLVILLGIFVAWMGVGPADVPNLPSAEYLKRGNEIYAQGRFAEAAKEYELALRVDGNNVSARVNLGNAYFSLERLDDAAWEFKAASDQAPSDADVHSNLAAVLIRQGKIEEALTEAQKAVDLKDSLAEAHYILGVIYRQKGQNQRALDELEKTLKLTQDARLKAETEALIAQMKE